jgi:hypothetical protein
MEDKSTNTQVTLVPAAQCDHFGDHIPFACYRVCKKCGEFYNEHL